MVQEKLGATSADPGQEVERIRDIIFGAQMRDYQQQFDAVTAELRRLEQALAALGQDLSAADREQARSVQELRDHVQRADSALRDELQQAVQSLSEAKVDRARLGDLLIALGTQLKADGKA
ncbi:MAG: hypothetical protein JXA09_11150 [Anaerolineae bacterium]|nr:hypothetical protein [Anaerolineae bacterium]